MTVSVATDNVHGPRVDIALRRGTNTMMCTVNTVGRNGNEVVFYTFFVRVWRMPDGGITGHQFMTPQALPSWTVAPVLDSTADGVRLTVGSDGPQWRSTVRPDLIGTV